MFGLKAWRHHLANEAHRRTIANDKAAKKANTMSNRAWRDLQATLEAQHDWTPEREQIVAALRAAGAPMAEIFCVLSTTSRAEYDAYLANKDQRLAEAQRQLKSMGY